MRAGWSFRWRERSCETAEKPPGEMGGKEGEARIRGKRGRGEGRPKYQRPVYLPAAARSKVCTTELQLVPCNLLAET